MRTPWLSFALLTAMAWAGCKTKPLPHHEDSAREVNAERRALEFLSQEVPRWHRENKCFSCHNNGDAARALFTASASGFRISRQALADTIAWLQKPEEWDDNKGDPAFSDKRLATIQFTVALATAWHTKNVSDERAVSSAIHRLIKEQDQDGAWRIEPAAALGSPATYGTYLATALAAKALRNVSDKDVEESRRKAERWLLRSSVGNVLESAAVLMALGARDDSEALGKGRECLEVIRRAQTRDGGWGPYTDSPPEPFDSAIVLLGLMEVRRDVEVNELVQRGREFLVRTQLDDGSWPETTRPPRGESYAQRISTTGWATLALLRSARVDIRRARPGERPRNVFRKAGLLETSRRGASPKEHAESGGAASVAQIFNLPYRRIAFGQAPDLPTRPDLPAPCRLKIGDTAD